MAITWPPPSFDPKPSPVARLHVPEPIEPMVSQPTEVVDESASESLLEERNEDLVVEQTLPVKPALTEDEIEAIKTQAHVIGYEAGYQDGFRTGKEDGHRQGTEAGASVGYQQAYSDAQPEIERVTKALKDVLQTISGIPETVTGLVNEMVFEVAMRLTGNASMERGPFVAAVRDALVRLPRPGESLFLRINPIDLEVWQKLVEDPSLPFECHMLQDAEVFAGHAYVEFNGARVDIGANAREALIRNALGLPQAELADPLTPASPASPEA